MKRRAFIEKTLVAGGLAASGDSWLTDIVQEVGAANTIKSSRGKSTRNRLEADYRHWLCELLPRHFRSAPEEQFAPHHQEFWDWGWADKPEIPAGLLIWNRGGAKSTSAEALAVSRGARKLCKYVLYVCRTQDQADGHVGSINSMLLASKVGQYYPSMTAPRIQEVGNRKKVDAWNRQALTTAEGWTVQGYGLLSSMRGIRVEEYRPDLIIVSDIDDLRDSTGMVDTLARALAGSLLGTMGNDCIVLFEQNLIHRDSVMNRILTRKIDTLSVRREFGPVPAVRHAEYARPSDEWFITKGEATWPAGMSFEECQAKLNKVGKDEWEREYQHNVELAYPDAIYPMFSELFHVITWDEFAAGFIKLGCDPAEFYDDEGKPKLPHEGNLAMAQDWGNNHSHPCANRWAWRPTEGMCLTDSVFYYREMCWPRFPKVEGDDRLHPSALKVGKAVQEVEKYWLNGNEQTEDERMLWRLASHERPEIVEAYLTDMPVAGMNPLTFQSINTAEARQGILRMQDFLTIIEDEAHPFRVYPQGHPKAGQPLQGRPRIYFVVARGQGELYWDAKLGELKVRPAMDEFGMARTRFEYPRYRKPDTQQGAERKDAMKRDDDVVDVDRAIAGRLFPTVEELSQRERLALKYEAYFQATIKQIESAGADDPRKARALMTAMMYHDAEAQSQHSSGHYLFQAEEDLQRVERDTDYDY